MQETSTRNRGKTRIPLSRVYALVLAVLMLLAFTVGGAYAAMPPANADIGNQATATYNDGVGGPQKSANSNVVHTFVQQVWSIALSADQTKTISAGGTIYFRHTVTNNGNGSDTITIDDSNFTLTGGSGLGLGSYYSDNAGTLGSALGSAPNPTILAGGSFSFWYAVSATAAVTNTAQATIVVKANDGHVAADSVFNTDHVTVNPYANLQIDKSIVSVTGPVAGVYTIKYNIHYVNNGNAAAGNLTLTDVLPGATAPNPSAINTTYVAGSGLWSGSGATVLPDNGVGNPAGITYSYTAGSRTVSAIIATIPANGGAGDLNFSVTYPAGTAPGTMINNTAHYTYNDGGPSGGNAITGDAPFNYQIPTLRSVVLDDIGSTNDQDGSSVNDTVTRNSAPQGSIVWFDNVLHNTGNVADNYALSVTSNTFTGTVQYYDAQNGTLISGTSASVPAGSSIHVWVAVTLPMNGTGSTGGPYSLTLKATSVADSSKADTVIDTLTAITAAAVDITNGAPYNAGSPAPGQGVFANGEAAPVTTLPASNTAPAVFSLYINNIGTTDDTFQLSYSTVSPFDPAQALPTGWTLTFNANTGTNCSSYNPTAIGSIAVTAGSNVQVCAVITPVSGAAPATQQVYFKAYGSNTHATDVKHDAVSVSTGYSFTVTPNNVDTISPSGSKIYSHTVKNNSNVAVAVNAGSIAFAVPTNSLSANGWASLLCVDAACATQMTTFVNAGDGKTYYDLNQIAPSGGIPANGGQVAFYVKVMAPGTTLGDVNTTTITLVSLKSAGGPKSLVSATDTTTIQAAQLTVQKYQAYDAGCAASTPGARAALSYGQAAISNAAAGSCVHYKLVVHNGGNQQAAALQVKDSIPAFVWYWKGTECSPLAAAGSLTPTGDIDGANIASGISEPPNCAAAGVGNDVIFGTGAGLTLNSNSTATLYFSVEVQK